MRYFATKLGDDGKIEMVVFSSAKQFMKTHQWCDNEFIDVISVKDLEWFEFADEKSMVIYSETEQLSRLALQRKFFEINGERK